MRWLLFLAALPGCITSIEEHDSHVGVVVRDCIVPPPAGIQALGAPVSLEYADASLWIWPELVQTDGMSIANVAARITSSDEVCASGPTSGTSILALDAIELADNAARTDGRRLALVPTGGVVANDLGYLYYDHVLYGPGFLDANVVGTGLCVFDGTRCERVTQAGSTVLWGPEQRVLNQGGIVVDDTAIIAGCRKVASFEYPCTLAGVSVTALRDPAAYRVHETFDGWVDELVDASVLFDTAGALTLSHAGGEFLATTFDPFANEVRVQTSSSVFGDPFWRGYDSAAVAFDVIPAADWFVLGGREHAALRTTPRSIVVTYATTGEEAPGLHLVEMHFYGALR